MNRAIQIQSLFEEQYGKIAIGYHRTTHTGALAITTGRQLLKIGSGDFYGPGIYLTRELDSQTGQHMGATYGNYIIKAKVNLNNFLIFDRDIAGKVYGRKYDDRFNRNTILDQLIDIFKVPQDRAERMMPPREYMRESQTAPAARYFAETHGAWLRRYTKGLVFTGRHDGEVIVAYDRRSVMPIAIAHAPMDPEEADLHPEIASKPIKISKFVPISNFNRTPFGRESNPAFGSAQQSIGSAESSSELREIITGKIRTFMKVSKVPIRYFSLHSEYVRGPGDLKDYRDILINIIFLYPSAGGLSNPQELIKVLNFTVLRGIRNSLLRLFPEIKFYREDIDFSGSHDDSHIALLYKYHGKIRKSSPLADMLWDQKIEIYDRGKQAYYKHGQYDRDIMKEPHVYKRKWRK